MCYLDDLPARDEQADAFVVEQMKRQHWRYDGRTADGLMLRFSRALEATDNFSHPSVK